MCTASARITLVCIIMHNVNIFGIAGFSLNVVFTLTNCLPMTCVNRLLYLNKKFYLMLMTCDSIKVESVLNNCYRTDVMG